MSNLLIKSTELGIEKIFPKNYILNLIDKDSGKNLQLILNSFNMLFLSYAGNKAETRKLVPLSLRKLGLWITYVIDKTVVTEWYNSNAIDDSTWRSNTYWMLGSNMLVGDISISSQGTWVVNGEDTGISPKGDKGDSPLIRIYNNKILVSYDKGATYLDLNNTPVYTKFRFNSLTNTYLVSYDLGANWEDISDEKVYHKFKYNLTTNTYQESLDFGKTWSNISAEKVYIKFKFNRNTNTYQVSTDLGLNWTDVSSDKVYYLFRYNGETNTHLVSTDFGTTWTNVSEDKVFYLFRTNDNRLLVSTDLGTTWENCSEPIAAWFRWADVSGSGNIGKILISRDNKTWSDLSPIMTNNLYIKGYVTTIDNLPSDAAIGDIYMVGPTYDEDDTMLDYPHYRMWVKLSSGWVDNGEYTSVETVSSYQDTDPSKLQSAKTHIITHEGNAIKPMTDFNSIFDINGKPLTDEITKLNILKNGVVVTEGAYKIETVLFSSRNVPIGTTLTIKKEGTENSNGIGFFKGEERVAYINTIISTTYMYQITTDYDYAKVIWDSYDSLLITTDLNNIDKNNLEINRINENLNRIDETQKDKSSLNPMIFPFSGSININNTTNKIEVTQEIRVYSASKKGYEIATKGTELSFTIDPSISFDYVLCLKNNELSLITPYRNLASYNVLAVFAIDNSTSRKLAKVATSSIKVSIDGVDMFYNIPLPINTIQSNITNLNNKTSLNNMVTPFNGAINFNNVLNQIEVLSDIRVYSKEKKGYEVVNKNTIIPLNIDLSVSFTYALCLKNNTLSYISVYNDLTDKGVIAVFSCNSDKRITRINIANIETYIDNERYYCSSNLESVPVKYFDGKSVKYNSNVYIKNEFISGKTYYISLRNIKDRERFTYIGILYHYKEGNEVKLKQLIPYWYPSDFDVERAYKWPDNIIEWKLQVGKVDSNDADPIECEVNFRDDDTITLHTFRIQDTGLKLQNIKEEVVNLSKSVSEVKQKAENALTEIPDKGITIPKLADDVKALINAGGGGSSSGGFMPDGEYITLKQVDEGSVLTFANKLAGGINGYGRYYVQKNIINGVNVLTKDLLKTDSINIIEYDYDLQNEIINIPSNVILDFRGGSFINGTLVGNQTYIISSPTRIFNNIFLKGSFKTNEWLIEWFGKIGTDASDALKKALKAMFGLSRFGRYPNTENPIGDEMFQPIVKFGNGIYPFESIINVDELYSEYRGSNDTRTPIFIKGSGRGTMLRLLFEKTNYTSLDNVNFLLNSNGYMQLNISDLTVVGSGRNNNQGFLHTTGAVELGIIENCYFFEVGCALSINNSYWTRIINNQFRYGGRAVYLTNANDSVILHNIFGSFKDTAVEINSDNAPAECWGTSISFNDFSGNHRGIYLHGIKMESLVIDNNYFENMSSSSTTQSYDIEIGCGAVNIFKDIRISNNGGLMSDYNGSTLKQHYGININCSLINSNINGYLGDCTWHNSVGNIGMIGYDSRNSLDTLKNIFLQLIDITENKIYIHQS